MALVTFNAGQGAFHWFVPTTVADLVRGGSLPDAGLVYDCGTMEREAHKAKLNASIDEFVRLIDQQTPRLLVLSHYHLDHHSHIRELARMLGERPNRTDSPEVLWVPRIDGHSMNLYLRVLAFGALFRRGETGTISDNTLEDFLGRVQPVKELLTLRLGIKVEEVNRGDIFNVPKRWVATALTPPHFPAYARHPISEPVGLIREFVSQKPLQHRLLMAIEEMLKEARSRPDYEEQMVTRFPEGEFKAIESKLPELVLKALASRPVHELHRELEIPLRTLLAISWLVGLSNRVNVRGEAGRFIPTFLRKRVRKWDREIKKATHLFNVAVAVNIGEEEC
jgi:hypothetical protein